MYSRQVVRKHLRSETCNFPTALVQNEPSEETGTKIKCLFNLWTPAILDHRKTDFRIKGLNNSTKNIDTSTLVTVNKKTIEKFLIPKNSVRIVVIRNAVQSVRGSSVIVGKAAGTRKEVHTMKEKRKHFKSHS